MSKKIQKPNKEEMIALLRAKQFLDHAKVHASEYSDFNTMIAIHNLDNANEYILRIIIKHLNMEEEIGRTINTCELSGLIGEIERFAKDNKLPQLPLTKEIKCIREMRNLVQHAMVNPNSDLQIYVKYSFDFFNKILERYFGIDKDILNYTLLIKNKSIAKLLNKSEKLLEEKKYLESIVYSRNAFEYTVFIYTKSILKNYYDAAALNEVKKKFEFYSYYVESNEQNMILNNLGVDIIKYYHFKEYINCIPKEYCSDWNGNVVLQRSWNKDDADFCLNFVSESVINIQDNEYKPIQDIPNEYKNCYAITKFNYLDITNRFSENNCSYFSNDKFGYSFYIVGKSKFIKMKKILSKEIICKTEIEMNGKKVISNISQFIKVYSKYIKFVSNEPAIWEVYLDFEYVPFTRRDSNTSNYILNIDEISNNDSLKKRDRDIILSYLPLDSVEKAFELKSKLKDYYNLNVNSLLLINKLK